MMSFLLILSYEYITDRGLSAILWYVIQKRAQVDDGGRSIINI